MKKLTYIFDSFALIAYLQAESGGQKVKELVKKAEAGRISVLMSAINFGEIIYIIERKLGRNTADTILRDISRLAVPVTVISIPSSAAVNP